MRLVELKSGSDVLHQMRRWVEKTRMTAISARQEKGIENMNGVPAYPRKRTLKKAFKLVTLTMATTTRWWADGKHSPDGFTCITSKAVVGLNGVKFEDCSYLDHRS